MSSSRAPETPSYRRYRRRRPSTLRLTVRIAVLSAAASLLIAAGLAWQLAQGRDPALGAKAQASVGSQSQTSSSTSTGDDSSSSDDSGNATPSGYSSTSSGYPSGYATSSPAPVTSSTS